MARLRSRLRLGVRGKLLALLAGTALLALLLACASFVYYDRTSTAAAKQRTIGVLTRSVAQSAFGPTAFGDPDSARVILEVLAAEPTARAGAIYGTDGARLASWERSPRDALPTARPTLADGIDGGRLAVTRAITGPDGEVGTLVVVVSTADLDARTHRFLALATAVLVVALLVAVVIAMVGQRFVTRPVRTLADAARAVQRDGNFDVRAARTSDDELGQLTDAFNAMLAMIQARDHELAGHRQNLEQLVARRTADLDRRNGQMRLVLDHVAQGGGGCSRSICTAGSPPSGPRSSIAGSRSSPPRRRWRRCCAQGARGSPSGSSSGWASCAKTSCPPSWCCRSSRPSSPGTTACWRASTRPSAAATATKAGCW
jgi:HAMP domain-containing protein